MLEAGLDPASAAGHAYAEKLIANQSADVQSIRQAMGDDSIMNKQEEKDTSITRFTNVMNGFVMDVPKAMIPRIKKMENVKRVFENAVHHFGEIEAAQETASQLSTFSSPASYDTDCEVTPSNC